MDTLTQRLDLLTELRNAGEVFLSEVRSTTNNQDDNNYHICQLITKIPKDPSHVIIVDITDTPETSSQVAAFDEPVFTWNGLIRDPIVTNANNCLINTSECFPPSLTLAALDYVAKGYGS